MWGAIMFSITSGQLPFIIQYLQRLMLGLGLGRPSAGGSHEAAAAGQPSPSLLTASWKQGLLGFRGC